MLLNNLFKKSFTQSYQMVRSKQFSMLLFQSKQFLHTVIKMVHSDQSLLLFLVYDYLTLCNALEKTDQPILRSGVSNGQTVMFVGQLP